MMNIGPLRFTAAVAIASLCVTATPAYALGERTYDATSPAETAGNCGSGGDPPMPTVYQSPAGNRYLEFPGDGCWARYRLQYDYLAAVPYTQIRLNVYSTVCVSWDLEVVDGTTGITKYRGTSQERCQSGEYSVEFNTVLQFAGRDVVKVTSHQRTWWDNVGLKSITYST